MSKKKPVTHTLETILLSFPYTRAELARAISKSKCKEVKKCGAYLLNKDRCHGLKK